MAMGNILDFGYLQKSRSFYLRCADGSEYELAVEVLRADLPKDVTIIGIEPVNDEGVQLTFDDGYVSQIITWEHLLSLV